MDKEKNALYIGTQLAVSRYDELHKKLVSHSIKEGPQFIEEVINYVRNPENRVTFCYVFRKVLLEHFHEEILDGNPDNEDGIQKGLEALIKRKCKQADAGNSLKRSMLRCIDTAENAKPQNRDKLFSYAIILGLNVTETEMLLMKGMYDIGFIYSNVFDLIALFCLLHEKPYTIYNQILAVLKERSAHWLIEAEPSASKALEDFIWDTDTWNEYAKKNGYTEESDHELFVSWLIENQGQLKGFSSRSYKVFREEFEKTKEVLAQVRACVRLDDRIVELLDFVNIHCIHAEDECSFTKIKATFNKIREQIDKSECFTIPEEAIQKVKDYYKEHKKSTVLENRIKKETDEQALRRLKEQLDESKKSDEYFRVMVSDFIPSISNEELIRTIYEEFRPGRAPRDLRGTTLLPREALPAVLDARAVAIYNHMLDYYRNFWAAETKSDRDRLQKYVLHPTRNDILLLIYYRFLLQKSFEKPSTNIATNFKTEASERLIAANFYEIYEGNVLDILLLASLLDTDYDDETTYFDIIRYALVPRDDNADGNELPF